MKILVDKDIKTCLNKIILNGDESSIQQSSYDLRVGDEIYFSERGKKVNLIQENVVVIKPFESVVIKTFELLKLPKDMMGLIFLRSKLGTKGFIYTGGIVDPGYEGYLWINLRNMSPRHEEIMYKQTIATLVLIQLDNAVENGYAEIHGKIDFLPVDRRPPIPERTLYDWIELSRKIDETNIKVDKVYHEVSRVHQVLVGLIYACVAGIMAGLVISLLQELLTK